MAVPFDKSGIIEFFLIEAGEHLQNLNQGLLSLEKDPRDSTIIDELFRAAHTLKGSAAMMGFQGVSDIAHKAEDMLGQFRSGAIPICKDTLNFLFDSVDAVKLMVEGIAAGQPEDQILVESIGSAYKDVVASLQTRVPDELEETTASPTAAPGKDDLDLAWEKTFDADEEKSSAGTPPQEEVQNQTPAAAQMETTPAEPPEAPLEAGDETDKTVSTASDEDTPLQQEIEEAKKSGIHEKRGVGRRATDTAELEKQFIRVNIDRLDNLMNLVGEMIVNRNRLARQVDFIKTLREELACSQSRLLHEGKKCEEKDEYTLSVEAPSHLETEEQPGDFLELEFDRYDDFN